MFKMKKVTEFIIGILFLTSIVLLVLSYLIGLRNIVSSFGIKGIIIPILFVILFGLGGYFLINKIKHKKKHTT